MKKPVVAHYRYSDTRGEAYSVDLKKQGGERSICVTSKAWSVEIEYNQQDLAKYSVPGAGFDFNLNLDRVFRLMWDAFRTDEQGGVSRAQLELVREARALFSNGFK